MQIKAPALLRPILVFSSCEDGPVPCIVGYPECASVGDTQIGQRCWWCSRTRASLLLATPVTKTETKSVRDCNRREQSGDDEQCSLHGEAFEIKATDHP